jgi:hypothetical protein
VTDDTFWSSKLVGFRKAGFVLGLLALVALDARSLTFAFKPVQNYTVGLTPRAVAAGDFNSDAKMDLAVVNFGDPFGP